MLFAASAALVTAQQQQTTPEITNHQQYSAALVALLQKTLASLELCVDKESVEAQLVILTGYKKEMEQLSRVLDELATPSPADYVQAEDYLVDFIRTSRLINEEVDRLQAAALLTPELKTLLQVHP